MGSGTSGQAAPQQEKPLQFPGEKGPRNMYLDCQVGLIRLLRLRLILTIFFSVLASVLA